MEEKCVSIAQSPPTCDITSDLQGDPQKYYVNPRTFINNDVKQEKERHEEYCLINMNKEGNNDMLPNQKKEGTNTPHEGNNDMLQNQKKEGTNTPHVGNNDMLQNQKKEGTNTPHEGNNDMLQDQKKEGANTPREDNNDMLQDQKKEGANTPREDNNNYIFLKGSGQPCVTPKNRYEQEIKQEMSGSASTYDSTRRRTRIPHPKKRLLDATTKDGGFRKTLPTVVFPVAWERDDEEEKLGQLASSLWNETLDAKHVIQAKKPLKVVLDGPYGLSTRQIFWSQHAVLIAAEIGVTPFASMLQSIMLQYQQSKMKCPSCDHQWLNPRTNRILRKVDFIWLNQEQRSFEWFISLLSDLEIQQAEIGGTNDSFLDIHIFITSALHMNDMKALGLQLALDLLHGKSKRCLITGLKTRTQPGQPDWDKMFRELSDQRKGKVSVFYCGPSNLDRILHKKM
ncbi:NADPH oxidase 1-like [Tachypleus tridentatus]|uniref:NADPH oxidase 1-like n=1 Tax=Tachypleus tridentatus TaxID=6853 RepID=UPI003FD5A347